MQMADLNDYGTFILLTVGPLILIATILLDFIALKALGANKKLSSPTYSLFGNLCACGILYCLQAVFEGLSISLETWIFGEVMCVCISFITQLVQYATAFSFMFIAKFRYDAVHCKQFNNLVLMKNKLRCSKIIITLIWIFSMALAIPQSISYTTNESNNTTNCHADRFQKSYSAVAYSIGDLLGYVIPVIYILIIYIYIGFNVFKRRFKSNCLLKCNDNNEKTDYKELDKQFEPKFTTFNPSFMSNKASSHKNDEKIRPLSFNQTKTYVSEEPAKTGLAVVKCEAAVAAFLSVIIFVISWTPLIILRLLKLWNGNNHISDSIYRCAQLIMTIHPFVSMLTLICTNQRWKSSVISILFLTQEHEEISV